MLLASSHHLPYAQLRILLLTRGGWLGGWVAGWLGGGCFLTIRLSQPSLAGVRAGAELGNMRSLAFQTRSLRVL